MHQTTTGSQFTSLFNQQSKIPQLVRRPVRISQEIDEQGTTEVRRTYELARIKYIERDLELQYQYLVVQVPGLYFKASEVFDLVPGTPPEQIAEQQHVLLTAPFKN